jgi:peroxiredoxin
MRRVASIVVATALTVSNGACPAAQSPPPAQIGRPAPTFTLRDLSGRTLDLATYRGRVVLLDFWATWCVSCREGIPKFIALQRKYGDRGLAVVGISMDDAEAPVRTFSQELGINYPIAMGDATLAERYGCVPDRSRRPHPQQTRGTD